MRCLKLGTRHQIVVLENRLVAQVLGSQVDDRVVRIVCVENQSFLHLLVFLLLSSTFLVRFR